MDSKIHIYLMDTSHNKPNSGRPEWFDYEKCFLNLIKTMDPDRCTLNVIFDGDPKGHYLENALDKITLHEVDCGGERNTEMAFKTAQKDDNIDENDLIYILENDYAHRDGWVDATLDLCDVSGGGHYISLFDHNDKYIFCMSQKQIQQLRSQGVVVEDHWGLYRDLQSKIYATNYCHWREVPNTCGSFILHKKIFDLDLDVHTSGEADNTRFGKLTKERGRKILTPMPGYSTHCQVPFLSPVVSWEKYL